MGIERDRRSILDHRLARDVLSANDNREVPPSALAIFLLDLLIGWTMLGWIGVLVWSATAIQGPVLTVNNADTSARAEID
jgi:hypothetical protein